MKQVLIIVLIMLAPAIIQAQNKKPLTFDEMTSWNSIKKTGIDNQGNFVVYEVAPLKGDSKVLVYSAKEQQTDTLQRAKDFRLSPDGQFLLAVKTAPYDSVRQAKIDKKKKDEMPKDSTILFHFVTGQTLILPKADSLLVSPKEGTIAGILLSEEKKKKEEEVKDSTATEEQPEEEITEEQPEEETADSIKGPQPLGKLLVIYNGSTGDTIQIQSVSELTISPKKNQLAFIEKYQEDSVTVSSCKIWDGNDGSFTTVFADTGYVQGLAFNEDGEALAFLFSADTAKAKTYMLCYSSEKAMANPVVQPDTPGMPEDFSVSDNGKLDFSENGKTLFFGTAKIPVEEAKDTVPADEIPELDLWSWTDKRLQPQQKLEVKKDRKKTYKALWHVGSDRIIQLADSSYSLVYTTPKQNANFALLANPLPYLRESNWTGLWKKDLRIINLQTGEKTEVAKAQDSYQFSRAGKYVVWYNIADTCYYAYSVANKTSANISKAIPQKIYNELEDHPIIPGTYGIAGWTPDDEQVLIYDRYDIWKVDPEGKATPENITKSFGREHSIQLRMVDLDPENEFINLDKPVLLEATNKRTNKAFFYRFNAKKKNPLEVLFEGNYQLSTPHKARNSAVVLWTKESFKLFPDLILSDLNFKKNTVLSNVNPQQNDYLWGTVEPYQWISFRGDTLNGLLYKPENFDQNRKYPMIVYFYERNFDTQYRHIIPSPSRSIINKPFYTSNGYVVFVPDITYVDGYPGQSAYDCVVSGTMSLVDRYSWVDKDHMGIQGQSWGGYQTAYLVTQTDLYAAAMGGAVVSNMTSAYGGIRWGSGLNRMFQYEKTQSRIGGTLWDKTMLYIENSPLFHAPKVNTPLLLMHNDKDGAVPWYQGIEFFVALRRLNKPVWMLSYNGQPHNLSANAIADRVDLSKRMKQFFDHYLKREPAPPWLTKGIPAIDKGKELGY